MLQRLFALFVLSTLFILTACNSMPIIDSFEVVTVTPPPTLPPPATDIPEKAEATALAFYRAWELGDYATMYSLLTPRLQALIDSETFRQQYTVAQQEARVLNVNAQPLAIVQEGNSAELDIRVIWETAVVGNIAREHTVNLLYEGGRWGIDWTEGLVLPELEGGHQLRLIIETPARADILDRSGETNIAFQGEQLELGVIPLRLEDEVGFLNAMSQLLGESTDMLRAKYANSPADWYTPLGLVSPQAINDNYDLVGPYLGAGLEAEGRTGRIYSPEAIAPHVVGYTGPIDPAIYDDYWAQGYNRDERVGVAGVEAAAEPFLRGTPGGQLLLVDQAGTTLDTVAQTEAIPARNVYTTFDYDFQMKVQKILSDAVKSHPVANFGSIVVLDVNTGAVRAMASYPSYDPGFFAEIRDPNASLDNLFNDPARPLLNRAAQGEYPSGSTFKIVTTAAALESGAYQRDSNYNCIGVWDGLGVNNRKYDWLEGGHGTVELHQGLTRSCNPWMYEIGFVLDSSDPFLLPNLAREFGLGARTGIGIAEGTGIIPDPEWKINNLGEGWVAGDAVNMAIGQGFLLATPLQITNMSAAVANGGTVYQPYLIDRAAAVRGVPETITQPIVARELSVSDAHIATLQQAMDDVTDGPFGTASGTLLTFEVPTAGKTGTAEVPDPNAETHAWFTGYAPSRPQTLENGRTLSSPEIAVTVMIENAGEGSGVAVPIWRQVIEAYYDLEITPVWWNQNATQ